MLFVPALGVTGKRVPELSLEKLAAKLISHYPVKGWWPHDSRFEIMVGAVLVQNTRWANAEKAISALKRAEVLESAAIAALDTESLIGLIRPAGCQSVKARRLVALARWIEGQGGIDRLTGWKTSRLRAGLLSVHGIGPETADAILCFAFQRPVFVADLYARRILQRYGLLDSSRYPEVQRWVQAQLPNRIALLRDLHAALVLHGQTVCGRRPRCSICLLSSQCRRVSGISSDSRGFHR